MSVSISFGELSDFLIQNGSDKNLFHQFIRTKFSLNNNSFELYRKQIDQFVINHDLRWKKKSKGRKQHFLDQYGSWLENLFILKDPSASNIHLKPFDECSIRTKKRRMNEIRQTKSVEEIEGAYMNIVRENSKIDAEIIAHLQSASPNCKELILQIIRGEFRPIKKYTADEALALMVDLRLTTSQYEHLHSHAKHKNADIYPPYNHIVDAKKRCYPPSDSLTVSDYGAAFNLQELVNHTSERLIQTCDQNEIQKLNDHNLEIIYKWGLDGASGQSCYKQKFKNDPGNSTDASVLMIAMVPLRIKSHDLVVWENPQPSSTKLCRPIKFDFIKETPETTNQQYKKVQDQMDKLNHSIVAVNDEVLTIRHKFFCTMIDGKTVNYLTSNPSHANCHICLAKPSEMNNYESLKEKESDARYYKFGISPLHCWIRFLECLLHISYRLPFEKWKVCTNEHKEKYNEIKERIQTAYRLEKG